jgi:hypothetical protein
MYRLRDAVRDKELLLVFAADTLSLAFRRAGRLALFWSHCASDELLILVLTSPTFPPFLDGECYAVRRRITDES